MFCSKNSSNRSLLSVMEKVFKWAIREIFVNFAQMMGREWW